MTSIIKTIFFSEALEGAKNTAEYRLAPDVLFLIAPDDSGRLLDLNGNFYAVTASGSQMLQQTLIRGMSAAVECIANQYNVDVQQVRKDLEIFLHELYKHGLLWCNPPPQHYSYRLARAILGC